MNEPVLKMKNKRIKCNIFKSANVIKLFWNEYVWKMHYEVKKVQNVLGTYIIENFSKIQKNRFYLLVVPTKTNYPLIVAYVPRCIGESTHTFENVWSPL